MFEAVLYTTLLSRETVYSRDTAPDTDVFHTVILRSEEQAHCNLTVSGGRPPKTSDVIEDSMSAADEPNVWIAIGNGIVVLESDVLALNKLILNTLKTVFPEVSLRICYL